MVRFEDARGIQLLGRRSDGLTARGSNAGVSDAELMTRLADGEVDLLGELYLRHGGAVRRRLACFVPDISADEVDDLCQEVFLLALHAASRYEERGQLRSWLCQVAAKKAIGWRRKRWLRRKLMGQYAEERAVQVPETTESPESPSIIRQQFVRALERIPKKHRDVLLMFTVEGKNVDEVAEALGIKKGAVWTRLHRARKSMRQAMKEVAEVDGPGERR